MPEWNVYDPDYSGIFVREGERIIATAHPREVAEQIVRDHNAALEAADRQAALAAELGRVRESLKELCWIGEAIEREWSEGSITSDGMAFLLNCLIRNAETGRAALATAPAVALTCPCGHPQYHHTGWPGEKTGNCLRCSCPAYGTVPVAPGAEDAGEGE